MLSSLFSIKRAAVVALIMLAFGIRAHAQIDPDQINFANGACTSLQYYSPFDNSCHSISAGGSPNGRVVTASTTAACGEFIRDNAGGTSTITLPAVSTGCTVAVQRGVSAGVITIDPGATAYDGVTTQLPQGESVFVWTDGTGWHSNSPMIPGAHATYTPSLTGNTLDFSASGGLSDPGGNGFVYRTALNTTAVGTLAQVIAAYWSDSSCSSNLYMKNDGTCGTPSGGGGGYTNLIASATTDTTVAIINGRCTTGQAYLLSTAATLTAGGTINCPVVHSAGGQWSAGSAITVTLGGGLSDLSLAAIPTRVAGTNITLAFTGATQTHAPVEWWGAVPYQTASAAAAGTDSTTFVQACLTAHPVQCDVLYGLYRVTSALSITHDNVGIHGPVMQFIDTTGGGGLISTSASADIIDVTGASVGSPIYNNRFDNFTIYRSVAATGTAKGLNVQFTRSTNINWVFSADSVYDYYLLNMQDSNLENSWAYWANSYSSGNLYGIYVDASTNPQSMYLFHNTILGGAQGGTVVFHGLYEIGASMNDLWSEQLEVSNANYGIEVDGTSVTTSIAGFDISFKNSKLDGLWNSGIKATNVPAVGNSTVQFSGGECSLQPTAASGTAICADAENNTGIVEISHMQFSQGFHAGNQGWMAAIYAKNSSNFIATDNSIIPVTGFYGIEGDGLTTSTIGNNSIKLLGGISGAKGLYLTGTSTGNTLLGNSITGASGTTGLQFDASATGNIALNTYASVTTTVTDTPGTNRWCDSTACHNFTSLATLPAQAADTTVGNYKGSSAAPTANVMPTCTTGASRYDTALHAWQCVSVGGSGAMTNLTGTVTISGACALSGSACVVSTPGNSITFSSIPSGYNKLHIDVTGRFSDAANSEDLGMRFNGDTGNNYRYMVIANNANAPYGPAPTTPADHIWISSPPAATPAAGFVGNASVDIPVYTGTTFFKTSLSNAIAQMAVTNFFFAGNIYGEWQSTSAITSITLYDVNGGNFVAGSTVVIYGVN